MEWVKEYNNILGTGLDVDSKGVCIIVICGNKVCSPNACPQKAFPK
ncbi:hypothetical protein [Paraclostridium dentum]